MLGWFFAWRLTACLFFCLLAPSWVFAHVRTTPAQAPAQADAGLLTVTGTVVMPDGSPVAGGSVATKANSDEISSVARTDNSGGFQLQGVFGNGARLHASTADGKHQSTLWVSSASARATFASRLTLTLLPAVMHEVTVLSDGRPVKGAQVAAVGASFKVLGETDSDGRIQIRLPVDERLLELAAWHSELGVAGNQVPDGAAPQIGTRLSLLAPGPFTVRAVDQHGKVVAGLELAASVRTEDSEWIVAGEIAAAQFRTDADGTASVPWVPRDKLKYFDIRVVGADWKIDDVDWKSIAERITTVYVRRKKSVVGRLSMPKGANAEGILITGFGFGTKGTGDNSYARARRDGSFTLQVPSDHGYVLGIVDLDWAGNIWSGMVLESDTAEPAEIKIAAYPATPVSVRVTRGSENVPIEGAWVEVSSPAKVDWVAGSGEKRGGSASISGWLRTNASGIAQTGVGLGPQKIRLSSSNWNDERTIQVKANERVAVEFHRAWLGDRRITGRLMIDGAAYQPSPTLVARAWTPRSAIQALTVATDGSFEVAFDDNSASLLFVDRDRQRSAFAQIGPVDSKMTVPMQPTATYSGTLVDENSRPMADRTLRIAVTNSPWESAGPFEAVAPQQTDIAGRFRFTGVPADIPLQLRLGKAGDYHRIVDGDRLFKPAEEREQAMVRPVRGSFTTPIKEPPISLADSVTRLCRDARLNGMRGLVILQGEDSAHVARMAGHVLDYDQVTDVLAYVPLRVEAAKLEAEAVQVADYGWPQPAPGEIVLVALGGDEKMIATLRIKSADAAAAATQAAGFLSQHRPPVRDAAVLLAKAQAEATASGRRVWIVASGPRCGPCYRLARWMDDHGTSLAKDYVIIKLMEGLDQHVAEVLAELPRKEQGIPWYAITEPDGKVLATSNGPLGNIGIPDADEGLRHLRQMLDQTAQRLTSEEKDALIQSLSPGR